MKKALGLAVLIVSLLNLKGFSQTNTAGQTKAITTAVPFLLITPDSRAGGMGETGVAVAKGANAFHWNLSALAFSENKYGFAVNYTPWLRGLGIPDINLAYLPAYLNLGEKQGVVATEFRFFSLGNIQLTDDNGIEHGQYSANEYAIAVGYSRKVTDNLSAGTAIRYIHSNLANNASIGGIAQGKPGRSVAGDLTLFYKKDTKLKGESGNIPLTYSWGIAITNIGAKMNYSDTQNKDFIPTNLRVGYAIKVALDDYNTITFTNDFNKLLVPSEGGASKKTVLEGMFSSFADAPGGFKEELKEIIVSAGLEYWYNELFAGRLGVFLEDKDKGGRRFMTFGIGAKFNVISVDFAYLQPFASQHPLQGTLRFSVGFDFK